MKGGGSVATSTPEPWEHGKLLGIWIPAMSCMTWDSRFLGMTKMPHNCRTGRPYFTPRPSPPSPDNSLGHGRARRGRGGRRREKMKDGHLAVKVASVELSGVLERAREITTTSPVHCRRLAW
eukprot:scaffold85643_cov27-Tisochrysis_lutea.AAC.1